MLYNFIIATDLHFEIETEKGISDANRRIECLIKDINKLKDQPDFVLIPGDITQCGCADINALHKAKKVLDQLRAPYFLVAGNHDLAPHKKHSEPGVEEYHYGAFDTSAFFKVFGESGKHFSFKKNNIQFTGVSLRNEDPDGNLDWLKSELLKNSLKKIVITHYGLYPPRENGPLNSWGFARIADNIDRLKKIIENPSANVVSYLHGHDHINSVNKQNKIYHISCGGIQRGSSGYWQFCCHEDKIEGGFYLLSDKSIWNFNYWGVLKPETCVDLTHSSCEEYHKGNLAEQLITIQI